MAVPSPMPAVDPHSPVRYFIADLHLDGRDNERASSFRSFLKRLSDEAKTRPIELYILGDLFEFWYEYRSKLFELYAADLRALTSAWEAGVKIFLFYGNRDFTYGKYVNRRFGATVLGDGQQITLSDSRKLWMEHGDLLCTDDRRYLRFRKLIRSRPSRVLFFLMPWPMARRAIERIRNRSSADKARKSLKEVDVNHAAARQRLEQTKSRLLLCGHTHRPCSEDLGAGFRLIVLPPWCEKPAGFIDDERGFRAFAL
jgi:UDP-2,3-diacylglucosamine hydrolase